MTTTNALSCSAPVRDGAAHVRFVAGQRVVLVREHLSRPGMVRRVDGLVAHVETPAGRLVGHFDADTGSSLEPGADARLRTEDEHAQWLARRSAVRALGRLGVRLDVGVEDRFSVDSLVTAVVALTAGRR